MFHQVGEFTIGLVPLFYKWICIEHNSSQYTMSLTRECCWGHSLHGSRCGLPKRKQYDATKGTRQCSYIACCNSSRYCILALARNELTTLIKTLVLGSFSIFGRSICESSQIHVNARGCIETSWNVGQGASYVGSV